MAFQMYIKRTNMDLGDMNVLLAGVPMPPAWQDRDLNEIPLPMIFEYLFTQAVARRERARRRPPPPMPVIYEVHVVRLPDPVLFGSNQAAPAA